MKVITVVGARPQFIKSWPVSIKLKQKEITEYLIHTGQHYDDAMSKVFFDQFQLSLPKYRLESGGGLHGAMTGNMLIEIEKILIDEAPDAVLVYGDTNSTLAGALAASKLNISVIHVEAGLRSGNKRMPEEQNRILTDHMSSLLLCPTRLSVNNLEKEGLSKGVVHVGDCMFDAAMLAKTVDFSKIKSDIVLEMQGKEYVLLTLHRAENTKNLEDIFKILKQVKKLSEGARVVFPAHPRLKKFMDDINKEFSDFIIIEPVSYFEMCKLLQGCNQVFTDSGGLQKEAYFHQKRCTTLREETEWTETIEHGWNRLLGENFRNQKSQIDDYGQGDASTKIVDAIVRYL